MSGPKVVRIVTLEEIQAICQRLMTQADGGGAELLRLAKRLGVRETEIGASVELRTVQLRQMFAAGRWMELQKLAMDAIAFHPAEMERLRAIAASTAEAARSRRRRVADSARTVAEALESAGLPVPALLREVVTGAATAPDAAILEMERRVGAAISALPTGRGTSASRNEAAQGLAQRLAGDDQGATITEWAAARQLQPTQSERRLDKLAAELDILDTDEAAVFSARIAAVAIEAFAGRRAMLTDSLVLDLSARVAALRCREAAMSALRQAAASLATFSGEAAAALRARVEAAVASRVSDGSEALVDEVKGFLDAEQKAAAAAARRRVVLGALSSLGYEVRESMEKVWTQTGRIVVRKPGMTDYGVEVGAPNDASRLQVRLVGSARPEQPRTSQRDKDQEVSWCGDFDRLKAYAAERGAEVIVERAVEPGAHAVRTVVLPATASDADAAVTANIRQLPRQHGLPR
jgi:hypothetical protein